MEYLSEWEQERDKVGMDLMPVGVVEEWSGEDEDVEDDAEDVRHTKESNEVGKELLELEFGGYDDTNRYNIA